MDSNEQKSKLWEDGYCSPEQAEKAFRLLDGRWKLAILYHLFRSEPTPLRFSELERLIPNVSQRMLTMQLRSLERHGIVRRDVFAEVPPRVQYALTFFGREPRPVLHGLLLWANKRPHFQAPKHD